MTFLNIIFFIMMIYHLAKDDSPYLFQNILEVKLKNKPFIALAEMKYQLKVAKNPEHIKELKRVIKNRRTFWVYFALFVVNFFVIFLLGN